MAPFPSERQKNADRLARELSQLGATVISLLPLAANEHLRFWVSDYKKNGLLQQLKDAGYGEPIFLGMSPQLCVESYSMGLVNNFELPIAAERQPIPQQDRTIPRDEIGPREKPSQETQAFLREWYGVKKR